MGKNGQTVSVQGRALKVSSLDKVMYPSTGTTKGEVLDYYARVASSLIPHAMWRPATRKRWVDGVGTEAAPGAVFFRKDLEDSAPSWIPTASITHRSGVSVYPLVNEPAVLAWLGQVAALEVHVPQWKFDSSLQPQNPDRLVLDLDPGPGAGLAQCAQVALLCREILEGMDMECYPVTSGSKGIHLYAALDGTHTSEQISAVAKELALSLQRDLPDLVVSSVKRSLRENKVLVDWSQNNAAKTTICPYSLRGRLHPTVAAPRTWEEIADPKLAQLDFRQVLERMDSGLEPLAPLGALAPRTTDRLETYRSKRDAQLTPEPVPEFEDRLADPGDAAKAFVIQEHHARRLHWDFRLEHDGVLVSWAVPKGPPLAEGIRRLAVMTEDHPLSYGSFEGSIPKGEYGAGEVSIWDAGSCVIEKWCEDKEVIAVLHGREDGGLVGVPRRFALVRAQGMGEKKNWLLQLMREQPEPGTRVAPPRSVRAEETARRKPADLGKDFSPAPMLASIGEPNELGAATGWSFEMKWDGYRALATVGEDSVFLSSRNGKDLSAHFPELAQLARLAPAGSILDGEIVALNSAGRPDFSLLQQRLSASRKSLRASKELPAVQLLLFDAIALPDPGSGRMQDLTGLPYHERRQRLQAQVSVDNHVKIPQAHPGSLDAALETSRELGLEGVMAKETKSRYEMGKRSRSWLKLKHELHQEVVVIGWREGNGSRSGSLGSLLLAVPENGQLRYVGRVGTGFSDKQLSTARHRLDTVIRKTPAVQQIPADHRRDAHWVTPKFVAEVRYSELTREGRLRHPVWRGWRAEKSPDEVTWEHP
ncbi:ATP-dependent DNA ligase [Glutamicibacter ardleyensis]|uniref:DNA ligase (ATP) n=1 Tax=Glutamicibacter ardleyensis TaxID=225894 RepID=A0ABQ2DKG2_9MICC|nr:ATP-dependent DNA ligase [Glutamicibacter ardleyensis]GGJ61391.1 ATP-dependent DNA ligase [Glutamicibacter ardleyensis]